MALVKISMKNRRRETKVLDCYEIIPPNMCSVHLEGLLVIRSVQ